MDKRRLHCQLYRRQNLFHKHRRFRFCLCRVDLDSERSFESFKSFFIWGKRFLPEWTDNCLSHSQFHRYRYQSRICRQVHHLESKFWLQKFNFNQFQIFTISINLISIRNVNAIVAIILNTVKVAINVVVASIADQISKMSIKVNRISVNKTYSSESFCCMFGVFGQLSQTSPIPSKSMSIWSWLAINRQLSFSLSIPSLSMSWNMLVRSRN